MRISCTTLESFRLFLEQDWMTEADLLATIRGEFVATPEIRVGRAFGKVLETPTRFKAPHGYSCEGYSFSDATMTEPLALMDHRHGVFEAKAEKAYGDCTVVAKADQIVGAHLFEHKTTCGSFTVEKYLDSYQWRFMADLFEPLAVTYHVFLLNDHGNGVVELRGIETLNVFPYDDLHNDCADLVRRFADYVTVKGLDGLLRERQREAHMRQMA